MNPSHVIKPRVTEELAKELAGRLYGLTVTSITQMVSFDDKNFHILVSKKHKNPHIKSIAENGYTLKITNTIKSSLEGHFDAMHSTMVHLHEKGFKVPLPVLNIDGKTWRLEKIPLWKKNKSGESCEDLSHTKLCGVHLLTYIPGVPVSTISYTSDVLYQWGRLLAQFHNAVEDFRCQSLDGKSIFWSLEQVPNIREFMDGLDAKKKQLVLSVLDQYPEKITKNISELTKGFIHGDFNENNVLARFDQSHASGNSVWLVEGILDFEDIHYGTYVWDVGMLLAYSLLECKTMDPLEGAGHAFAGYRSIRSFNDTELSLIKMCIACRLSQSLVLGAYSYRLDPQNPYLIVSARTGWSRLERICETSNETLLQKWNEILKLH